MNKDTLLLVDSNSILHRAYHAYPLSLVTAEGQPINAVYGLASMLLDAILKIKPRYIACAFDTKAPTFRHTKYTGYKATRVKTDDTLISQVKLAHKLIEVLDLPLFLKQGYEADDIIATIANIVRTSEEYKNKIGKVLILTSDRDLFALVDNFVHVIMPQGSFKNLKEFGPKEVLEKMHIKPNQVYDYKALAGDSSDNIPGVRGIGDKTAVSLLTQYKSIKNIYKHIYEIEKQKKSIATKLINDQQNAFLSYELAQIKQDVPIIFDINKAHLTDFDFSKAWQFFTQLEFKSLLNKLKTYYIFVTGKEPTIKENIANSDSKIDANILKHKQINFKKPQDYKTHKQIKNFVDNLLNILENNNIFYYDKNLDTLYFSKVKQNKLNRVDKTANKTKISNFITNLEIYYPLTTNNKSKKQITKTKIFYGFFEFLLNVTNILEDSINTGNFINNTEKATANTKSDTSKYFKNQLLQKFIKQISNIPSIFDISLVAYGLTTGRSNYSLNELATIYANLQQLPISHQDLLKIILQIAYKQQQEIKKLENYKKTFKFLTTIVDPRAILGVAIMQNNGINVDLTQVFNYKQFLEKQLQKIEQQIFDSIGFEFNVKSTKQLANVLFNILKLPTFKKRKTGYSTDSETLNALYNAHPAIPLILEHRKLQKILSTYVKPYLELKNQPLMQPKQHSQQNLLTALESSNKLSNKKIQQNNANNINIIRIHSQFNPIKTTTGRLASSNPNLQNLPIRTEEGAKIREFFVPSPNHIFIKLDYSQIDLRVLAHTSKEKNMIIAFLQDLDIHKQTASQIFDVPYEKVTKQQRKIAKTINFGIVYGMSAHGLATTLNIKHSEAQEFINKYFEKYPGILEYVKQTEEFVKKHGFVLSLLGRRRFIYGITSNNPMRRQSALREAINMPIQGGSDDIIRTAIYEIFRTNKHVQQNTAKLVLQIHDELIFEVPNTQEFTNLQNKNSFANQIKNLMENVIKLDIPLKVGVEISMHI